MTRTERLFWRTHAGLRAWACADSGLPQHYRRILAALDAPTDAAAIAAAMRGYPQRELLAWLDQLDTLGFIQSGPAAGAYCRRAA